MRNAIYLIVGLILFFACDNSYKRKAYYPGGQLKAVIPYKDSIVSGKAYGYNEDGSLKSVTYFRKGLQHGERKQFYPSGQIGAVIQYKHGKSQGQAYYYFEDGSIEGEVFFIDDLRQGVGKFYHNNANLKQYLIYKNDTIRKSAIYREDGSLEVIREYNNDGKQFKYTHYIDSGRIDPNPRLKEKIILTEANSVVQGEMYEAIIRLGHMTKSDIYVFIGDTTDENLYSKPFLKRIDKESSLLKIDTDTCRIGSHILTGKIFETCDTCDGWGWEELISIEFYVTSPSCLESTRLQTIDEKQDLRSGK